MSNATLWIGGLVLTLALVISLAVGQPRSSAELIGQGDHVEICIDDTWFESSTCYVVEMEMLNADR